MDCDTTNDKLGDHVMSLGRVFHLRGQVFGRRPEAHQCDRLLEHDRDAPIECQFAAVAAVHTRPFGDPPSKLEFEVSLALNRF